MRVPPCRAAPAPTYNAKEATISGPDILDEYRREQQRRNRAASTINRTRRVLTALDRAVDPGGILAVTEADVVDWLDNRCELGPQSRYVYLSTVKTFFAWAIRAGYAEADPTRDIVRPRLPRRLPRPTADNDLAFAIQAADTRMRCWLLLASLQGLRCCEIAQLRRSDLLLDRDPPLLVVRGGKGDKDRTLPLHPDAELALRNCGLRDGYLFRLRSGRPLKAGTVSSYINKHLHAHGIASTAHSARHWFGSTLYVRTKDLRLVQEALGHADPKTTSVYAAFDRQSMMDAIRGLNVGRSLQPTLPM